MFLMIFFYGSCRRFRIPNGLLKLRCFKIFLKTKNPYGGIMAVADIPENPNLILK